MFPGPELSCVVEDEVAPRDVVESLAAQHLRRVIVKDQVKAAAVKVNLPVDMGLTRTTSYAEALTLYQTRLADFDELRTRLGL